MCKIAPSCNIRSPVNKKRKLKTNLQVATILDVAAKILAELSDLIWKNQWLATKLKELVAKWTPKKK